MGAKQSLEESDDLASPPRSPTSPRVLPVESGGETSMPAVQSNKDASRGGDAATPLSSRLPSSRRREDEEKTLVLKGHESHVDCLAALDGGRLASSGGGGIIIWNLADGTQLARLGGYGALVALDGDRLASGSLSDDNPVIIWNLASSLWCAKLKGHTSGVLCLAALDGNRLASGSFDKSVIVWNVADGTQLAKLWRLTRRPSARRTIWTSSRARRWTMHRPHRPPAAPPRRRLLRPRVKN